jgi:hypothetical protein
MHYEIYIYKKNISTFRPSVVPRFAAGCTLLSFSTMALFFFTPPLRRFIIVSIIGATPALASRCTVPLVLFAFFAAPVGFRAVVHGTAISCRTTKGLVASGPCRVVALVAGLWLFGSIDGVGGAVKKEAEKVFFKKKVF